LKKQYYKEKKQDDRLTHSVQQDPKMYNWTNQIALELSAQRTLEKIVQHSIEEETDLTPDLVQAWK
jgi:hypothetical protein